MIEIKNLSVTLGEKRVFNDFSVTIPDTGMVLISGDSGIGKTTLLRVLCGLQKPDKGTVEGLNGRKISVVFQESRLLDRLTALENVAIVSDMTTAERILTDLNMGSELKIRAGSLSGGQKQRVSLARAFAFSSDIVLLDEPFAGLDEENKRKAVQLIRTAQLAIVVSHDPGDAKLLSADENIQL
ncbi:MAG: ATP-binding cassette domain-containing protein [Clostridia bacterium]|nr:ATP-binding cassette domain-containing protein [Clostridia bacterium]